MMRKYIRWLIVYLLCMSVTLPSVSFAQDPAENGATGQSGRSNAASVDWKAISTLDLKAAVGIALSDNPGLAAAAARVRQAKEKVAQARSTYWPSLDAGATAARRDIAETTYQQNLAIYRFFDPAATLDNPNEYYSADLTASWTLFDGFERKFNNASARYGEKSSSAALKDARRLMISSVALSYFSAQLALENIAIAKADEAFNDRQLSDARARQRVGTGSLSDVLNFQVKMNQAKTTRINQEYQYRIALFGLASLLGVPESRFPEHVTLARLAPETSAELGQPQVDELIATAIDMRPDIQQARWGIRQTDAQIKVAQSDYYPSFVVSGSLQGERQGDMEFDNDDFGNSVQIGLSYNLFSGGLTRAKVAENRHAKVELEKNLEELILKTTSDIRSSVARVATAQTQVALQRDNVDLVQRTRDLVEKEYNAGQGSLVRLNEAQKDLTTAQSNLALALVALRQAWVELETRTGSILTTYGKG